MATNNKTSQDLFNKTKKYLFNSKELLPRVIQKGSGSYLWDIDNHKILDLNAGQFCSIFGNSQANINTVMQRQVQKILHTSTQMITPEVLIAAQKMASICQKMNGKVIFLSTGSEAVECALRFTKHIKNKEGFICFDTGYHGLTLGSQSVTFGGMWAKPKIDSIYIINVPIFHKKSKDKSSVLIKKSIQEIDHLIKTNKDKIAGLIMEPVISIGGMNFLPKEYCEAVYKLCKKYKILLIYDECQTGMGRTGKWFCYQHYNIIPDILVTAKGLGAGFPVSAVIFNGSVIDEDKIKISQYSSHQNDPLSAVIVSEVIKVINQNNLLTSIKDKGEYFLLKLNQLSRKHQFIKYPRGKGLMLGFNIYQKGIKSYRAIGKQFTDDLLKEGVLLQSTCQGEVYRILPNYFISKFDIDYFIKKLELVIKKYK